MLFARLFGRRPVEEEDEEPTARAPAGPSPAPDTAKQQSAAPLRLQDAIKPDTGKGFDPYNSGAFKRRDAWERINRR